MEEFGDSFAWDSQIINSIQENYNPYSKINTKPLFIPETKINRKVKEKKVAPLEQPNNYYMVFIFVLIIVVAISSICNCIQILNLKSDIIIKLNELRPKDV